MNDTIDDVAREMTADAPPDAAAFRRCVLARIDSGDAPRRAWRAWCVLAPIAATALVAIALFAGREHTPQPVKQNAMVSTAPTPSPAAALSRTGDPDAGAEAVATVSSTRGRPGPAPAGTMAAAATLEDTDAVAAIDVALLAVNTLSPESIQIERLDTIRPISVAPLDFTDEQRRDP